MKNNYINISYNKWLILILSWLVLTNIVIIFDIPLARQIIGTVTLSILPGALIVHIINLKKINFIKKIILSFCLSASFLIIFGLIINNLYYYIGYNEPLSTISLLVSLNIAILFLTIIDYKMKRNNNVKIYFKKFNNYEIFFLNFAILFPFLSIIGTYLMNNSNNNILLILLYLLIPTHLFLYAIFRSHLSNKFYSINILIISFSLLIPFLLRFPHIYGRDINSEYFFYKITLTNLYWATTNSSLIESCLSTTLLPVIFQSLLDFSAEELFFRLTCLMLCTLSPLTIYFTVKKYLDTFYAFVGSFFFMSQMFFLKALGSIRTSIAVAFISFIIMVLFDENITSMQKKFLIILFMVSLVFSHYSSSFIFLFIITIGWAVGRFFSIKFPKFDIKINLSMILILFAIIYLWHSQITTLPFDYGLNFFTESIKSMEDFAQIESMTDPVKHLFGENLATKYLSKINLALNWSIFSLIGLGVIFVTTYHLLKLFLSKYSFRIKNITKRKFEIEYLGLTISSATLLVLIITIPFISKGYNIWRLYFLVTIILAPYFIIGAKIIYKTFRIKPLIIILIILIPYFLFNTGISYQAFDINSSTILNSEGEEYNEFYIHDSESNSAKWMQKYDNDLVIYTPGKTGGKARLISQGLIKSSRINDLMLLSDEHPKSKGYVYLCYNNVIHEKVVIFGLTYDLNNFTYLYENNNKIYTNFESEIYCYEK